MADKKNPYGAEDTGHEWDGIRELKNPPPRWWMITFYLSGIWVIGYFLLYPSIPMLSDHTKGLLGWTQVKEYKEGLKEIEATKAPFENKINNASAAEILNDQELSNFAVASARVLFGDKCAACHGVGGQGMKNFPVLADDDWLYGGSIETIQESITDGRQGIMPGYKEMLSKEEISNLAKYVQGLSKGEVYEPGQRVFMGETEGAADCTGCHGEDAKGMPDMGSANLTDAIWRFSGTEAEVTKTILHGVNNEEDPETRKAVMPAWGEKLTENQIKKLAVFVHKFGGGQ